MKFALVVAIVALATSIYASPQEGYSTKYDNIDLDSILNNNRLLDAYITCLLGNGKCTPEGVELKKYFKDGIETCCSKCSDKQKKGSKKIISDLKMNKPEKLAEIKAKFDPTGEYEKACRKQLSFSLGKRTFVTDYLYKFCCNNLKKKMKYAVVFVFVALATIVYALPKPDEDKYPTKYDSIDIDSILSNERLLQNYIDCIEGAGKCTAEGEELKKHFGDALETCCSKCSDKQKEGVKKVFAHLEKEKPDKLKELKAKYDPEGTKEKECKDKIKA
ncbi:uncharacterized protein LOC123295255 [Chrysoperla carnea]|uniref:uncharacterized protein LOC123295255 n=1 Tax=Chrysoperla carnea TaxID=189513 RepID=UPI001D063D89|nr:uncharacterized protein LOC123295255 [Chrysoperla carnea]